MNIKLVFVLLFGTMILGLAISFFLYAGPDPIYDDATYLSLTGNLIKHSLYFLENRFTFGYLSIFPIAISFYLFNFGVLQAILPGLIEFEFIIIVAFLVGRELGGNKLALLSSFLIATVPFLVGYTTRVLIDVDQGAAVALAILILFCYNRNNERTWGFLYGFAVTLPLYVKTEGILFLASAIAFLVVFSFFERIKTGRGKSPKKKQKTIFTNAWIAYVVIGAFVGFVIYLIPFYFVTGDLFFIFKSYMVSSGAYPSLATLITAVSPFGYVNNIDFFPLGPIVLLAMMGTLFAFLKQNMRLMYISAVNWFVFVYLIFGSSSLSSYRPIPIVSRLFSPLALPLALLSAYFILETCGMITKKIGKNFGSLYLVVMIAVIMFAYLPTYAGIKTENMQISGQEKIFSDAFSYINGIKNQTNISIYVQAPVGFRLASAYFIGFLAGYGSNISSYIVDYPYFPFKSETCSVNNKTSSYLVDIYSPYGAATSEQNNTIERWLGNSCAMTQLKVFGKPIYPFIIYVYRLGKG